MPHPDIVSPLNSEAGFADLLASLAALKGSSADAVAEGAAQDQLTDDVATLSYEGPLRAHHRSTLPGYYAPATPRGGSSNPSEGRDSGPVATPTRFRSMPVDAGAKNLGQASRERKEASITIRMSQEECQRLRDRAAEAGITVSAYLRSCAFEVESLRAQVKQTLAELRSAKRGSKPAESSRPWVRMIRLSRTWLRRLWPGRGGAGQQLRDPLSA